MRGGIPGMNILLRFNENFGREDMRYSTHSGGGTKLVRMYQIFYENTTCTSSEDRRVVCWRCHKLTPEPNI